MRSSDDSRTFTIETADLVALVYFSESHCQNPFSQARMQELAHLMQALDFSR